MLGQGTFYYASGIKYTGEWKDNKKHGKGTKYWPDGNKEEWEYKDGERIN